jgi:hypothetical protein
MSCRNRVLVVHLVLGGGVALCPGSPDVAAAAEPGAARLAIDHTPVGCVLVGKFPRFEAGITPSNEVGATRVLFRPEGIKHWYSVTMKPEGDAFEGVLPKPTSSLKSFDYYIEATDRRFGTERTREYHAQVVGAPIACKEKMLASSLGSATVLLEVPAGAAPVPAGFASTGLVSVAAGTGAAVAGGAVAGGVAAGGAAGGAVAGGAAAGAAGGGIGTGALVVGGAVAVGAGVAVAATRGGGDEASVAGRWTGTLLQNEANGQCTANWNLVLNLSESGGRVTGDIVRTATSSTFGIYLCAEVGSTLTGTMTDGTQAANEVQLPFVFSGTTVGGVPYTFLWTFSGTVSADGRTMSGTLLGGNNQAPNNDTGPWTATRQ